MHTERDWDALRVVPLPTCLNASALCLQRAVLKVSLIPIWQYLDNCFQIKGKGTSGM